MLETYNLVQHLTEPTHRSQHLLDYIISDAELVNSAGVSDFVSDYCALHASLLCTRSHLKQKQITFIPLKTIDHDLLSTDISNSILTLIIKLLILLLTITIVDSIVDNCNTVFTSLLANFGTDHHQLLCRQLVRIVLTLSLSVHSFMLLHVNGTN